MELDGENAGPAKFGKFELVEKIGHGGMATVHRAILRGMGGFKREVVIKRILSDLAKDEHFVRMFIEEAKLSALLDHPNIVQVYDFGVIEGHYYLSMELIDGLTLLKMRKHYRRRNPFPPEAAALILHQVCLGLDYTHRLTRDGQPLGLVHRDVSPSNIMVSAHGEVKLLDFGIAKAVEAIDDELTRTGTLKGKWSYMSPEQVMGSQVTYRSDIFAAGIVLWEILAGRRLFKDRTDFLTLSNVANAQVPPLTTFRPELDPLFDAVCSRALARNPEDRYVSADEMADHLWTYVAEHPCTNSTLAAMITPLRRDDTVELQPEHLQEVSGEASESGSSSSEPGSISISEASAPESRESHTSLPRGEQEVVVHAPSPSRRLITIATAGFVAATLVVVFLLVVLRSDSDQGPKVAATTTADTTSFTPDEPPPPPLNKTDKAPGPQPDPVNHPTAKAKAEPASQPAATAVPEQPPPPASITVRVKSEPAGALIRLLGEDKARGSAPLSLSLSKSDKPIVLVASLPDHRPQRLEVTPDQNREIYIELAPLPPKPVASEAQPAKPEPRKQLPSRSKTAQKPPKKQTKRQTKKKGDDVPDLKSGDLADPYGD